MDELVQETANRLRCSKLRVFQQAAAACNPSLDGNQAYYIWNEEGYLHVFVRFFCEEILGTAHTCVMPVYRKATKMVGRGGVE